MTVYSKDDVVRIVSAEAGSMISPYVGCEARVLEIAPAGDGTVALYMIEVDLGRATIDRGGQRGPRFYAAEGMLEPEITKAMILAADEVVEKIRKGCPAMDTFGDDECVAIYRAMRDARVKR